MKGTRVAARYAKSLFSIALDQKALEGVKNNIDTIVSISASSNEFKAFLSSPVIQASKKIEIFKSLLGKDLDKLTLSFLDLVTKKRREQYLLEISNKFIELYKEYKSIVTVTLTTAHEMDKTTKVSLEKFIKGLVDDSKSLDVVEKVNDDLLGGFVVEIEDKRIDSSARKTMNLLKREFAENQFITQN